MKLPFGNLFGEMPSKSADESLETLVASSAIKIERIVSQGHASSAGFWYDQPQAEWVAVLSGEAILTIDGEPPRHLHPGDWLLIPPNVRHRVESTSAAEPTIWLAVHFDGEQP